MSAMSLRRRGSRVERGGQERGGEVGRGWMSDGTTWEWVLGGA
jgi:hypothetical protein